MPTQTIRRSLVVGILVFLGFAPTALGRYSDWRHCGTFYIITTPEGANLPASATEKNFPLLVRLHRDYFNFNQAGPGGKDIRFASSNGIPLPYQIEKWGPAGPAASIWVKIPHIRGNTRQPIKMYWGNDRASSESDGAKVFTTKAGFAGVWHLGDDLPEARQRRETTGQPVLCPRRQQYGHALL